MSPTRHGQGYAMFLCDEQLLVERGTELFILPWHSLHTFYIEHDLSQHAIYVGEFNHMPLHAVRVPLKIGIDKAGYVLKPVRDVLANNADIASNKILCRAKQLLSWHNRSLFCGICGTQTHLSTQETAKMCPHCAAIIYPYTSPAIIVLIQRDNEVLLGRSPHFPPGMYSALAGFVDPGESCEEAVVREVQEEVGIQVQNVRYFGSQSWPFPNSFMIGFYADYADGEICVNQHELEDAKWFHPHDLPLIPPPYSIARQMIDHMLNTHSYP
jgi:NAD+ diphosphatase